MVTPSLAQNSASHVSLPPGDFRPSLKSKVSISSVANAVFRRKLRYQDRLAHPKIFTKGHGPCTLTLNADYEAGSGLPIFCSGAVMSGSLEISKVSKTLHSIQIMVTIPAGAPVCAGRPRLTVFTGHREDHHSRPWRRCNRRKHHVFSRVLRMEPRIESYIAADPDSSLVSPPFQVHRSFNRYRASDPTHLQGSLERYHAGFEGEGAVRSLREDRPVEAEDPIHDKDHKVSLPDVYPPTPFLAAKICLGRSFASFLRTGFDRSFFHLSAGLMID